MSNSIHQYSIGKDNLYFFYRFIILRWELEWVNYKFISNRGDLTSFCEANKINIKSFESADKLNKAITSDYKSQEAISNGMLWFVKQETKPKDALRHLRNCVAHGSYRKRQKKRTPCIAINNIDKNILKAQGFIPVSLLNNLIHAIVSCKVEY